MESSSPEAGVQVFFESLSKVACVERKGNEGLQQKGLQIRLDQRTAAYFGGSSCLELVAA